ncbi:MAG: T9SS type A sorting domain-containing protein [Ignavibacteriae bacterium]|nr:T9SS type A sorting domain-containing protein [Ignavibacteriota bacterium]
MKRIQRLLWIVLVAQLIVHAARAGTIVSVTPAWQHAEIDAIVAVSVRVDSVARLRLYSVQLRYDASLLRCEGVEKLGLFSPAGSLFFFRIDSVAGIVTMDEGVIGPGGYTGSGMMTRVSFRTLHNGLVNLAFAQVNLRDTANQTLTSEQRPGQIQIGGPSSVHRGEEQNVSISLHGYPNPFNAATTISFSIPRSESVTLQAYTVSGAMIRHLFNGRVERGYYAVRWDGTDDRQVTVGSGVYYLVLTTGSARVVRGVLFLK